MMSRPVFSFVYRGSEFVQASSHSPPRVTLSAKQWHSRMRTLLWLPRHSHDIKTDPGITWRVKVHYIHTINASPPLPPAISVVVGPMTLLVLPGRKCRIIVPESQNYGILREIIRTKMSLRVEACVGDVCCRVWWPRCSAQCSCSSICFELPLQSLLWCVKSSNCFGWHE